MVQWLWWFWPQPMNVSSSHHPQHHRRSRVCAGESWNRMNSSVQKTKMLVADQNTALTNSKTVSAALRSYGNNNESAKCVSLPMSWHKFSNATITNVTKVREASNGLSTLGEGSSRRTILLQKSSAPPFQTLVGPDNLNNAKDPFSKPTWMTVPMQQPHFQSLHEWRYQCSSQKNSYLQVKWGHWWF